MKAVILAGGLGTRITEETHLKPKPMVEVGGLPLLWHIMKIYSAHGINEFIICCGYKGYVIKEYFANYFLHTSDLTFDILSNEIKVHRKHADDWKVTLIDTGESTLTGGRLKRVSEYLNPDESFCFTYGDGVANVNIKKLVEFHHKHNKLATLTSVVPPGRYGAIETSGELVTAFAEKPKGDGARINGGFFVLKPEVISFIDGDLSVWEAEPLEKLAALGELVAFEHDGFWQSMDTLRDKNHLEALWQSGGAPWKIW